MFKSVNGQLVEMTQDEIAERQAEEQKWADGPTAEELAAKALVEKSNTEAQLDNPSGLTRLQLKIAFIQENRIRALEGGQPITIQQFTDWVRGQIT